MNVAKVGIVSSDRSAPLVMKLSSAGSPAIAFNPASENPWPKFTVFSPFICAIFW